MKHEIRTKRVVLGCFAILMGGFFLSVLPGLLGFILYGDVVGLERGVALGVFVSLCLLFSLIFLGLPLHAICVRLKLRSIFIYAVIGFFAPYFIFSLLNLFGNFPLKSSLPLIAILGCFGVVGGIVFWYLAVGKSDSNQ